MMKKRARICEEDQKPLGDKEEIVEVNSNCQLGLMNLPTAILHDIFFRLPIASIIKVVKFVSKAFYKLLSDPDFTLNYTKNSRFDTLLALKRTDLYGYYLELVEASDYNECLRTLFKPKIPGVSEFHLVGACDGLVCIFVRTRPVDIVYLCNPVIGDLMPLPGRTLEDTDISNYGFGFCKSTKKFKVLRIIMKPYPLTFKGCEIFTIGIDKTWRVLPDLERSHCFHTSIAHNGAFYWFVTDNRVTRICTFDLTEEKIRTIPHPHGLELKDPYMILRSINNHLCVVDDRSNGYQIVIWKMKEYGVAESWTKTVILYSSVPPELQFSWDFPDTLSPRDGIIMFTRSGLYRSLYNRTNREVSQRIHVICHKRINYAPSFSSVNEAAMRADQSTMNLQSK